MSADDDDDLESAGPRDGHWSTWGFLSGYQPANEADRETVHRRRRREAVLLIVTTLILSAVILVAARAAAP